MGWFNHLLSGWCRSPDHLGHREFNPIALRSAFKCVAFRFPRGFDVRTEAVSLKTGFATTDMFFKYLSRGVDSSQRCTYYNKRMT